MNISLEDRVAVVTDSSFWLLDGHGRFRRTPRTVEGARPGEGLAYADWDDFASAEFVETGPAGMRLRVVPLGRPPGSVGLLSGAVRWTNVVVDPRRPERLAGPSAPWFPPSPVPADEDLWPGELPFTAFGQFGPDALDLRVFDQDVYWVDHNGDPHRIDEMGEGYIANVVAMLTERAGEFHNSSVLRETLQTAGDALQGRVNGSVIAAGLGIGSVADTDATTWLQSTPLMRRLLCTK
jgi:hypothetical protein